jgi:ligand-binding sensor domain-containing protein
MLLLTYDQGGAIPPFFYLPYMKGLLAALATGFLGLQLLGQPAQTDAFRAQPSELHFTHYGTAQGLSANFVYTVTQDARGFMWIGTHDGLNMFDGYRFKIYRHDPGDRFSIPGNTVTDVVPDHFGQIWLVANNQLGYLDAQYRRFTKLMPIAPIIPSHRILMASRELLLVESLRPKWVNTRTYQSGFISFRHPEYGGEKWPVCRIHFTRSRSGLTYAVSSEDRSVKLFVLDTLQHAFDFLGETLLPDPWRGVQPINACMVDQDRQVHIALDNNVPNPFSLGSIPREIALKTSGYQLVDFLEVADGDCWIATNKGLGYRKRATESIQWHRTGENTFQLRSDVIRDCYQDRTGLIWLATANGLHVFNPQQVKFRHFRKNDQAQGLLSDFILGLQARADGKVRVDYFNGDQYSVLSPSGREIMHRKTDGQDYHEMVREKILRIGGREPGDSLINRIAGVLRKARHPNLRLIQGIHADSWNAAWMVLGNKVIHLSSGTTHTLPSEPQDLKTLGDSLLLAIPGEGLMIFNTRTGKFAVPLGKDLLGSDEVASLLVLPEGRLYVGTKGNGLLCFPSIKEPPLRYRIEEGLAANSVYCMTQDQRGSIWIGTSAGVSCLDRNGSIRNFLPHHGFGNLEFNRHSACTLPDGSIFMGGMDGVDLFHPDSLLINQQLPAVNITDLRVYNLSKPVTDTLRLRHNQNQVSFDFAVMDFAQPERNRFQFMLEEVDPDWVEREGIHMATYSHLEPGRYRFLVRGANSDGNWNQEPAIVYLEILPAWYQTWWFYGLVLAMAGLFIYFLFNYRLRQKLQLYHTRQRIHRDLHDDVGATLSSVKAYSEILKAHPDNPVIPQLISENASEMIDRLDVISWATNPEHDYLGSLKNRMVKFASPLCHARQITFDLDTDGLQDTELIPGEIRQQLLMVCKEAVHNLVKYSGASSCKVSMFVRGRTFYLEVADNGKGTDGTVLGQGNGWKNMRERARQLGGEIRFESEPLKGTRVILQIPYPFRIPYSWGRSGQ